MRKAQPKIEWRERGVDIHNPRKSGRYHVVVVYRGRIVCACLSYDDAGYFIKGWNGE